MYSYIKERGYAIYPGKVTDANTFRIGNIGEIYTEDIEKLCQIINEFLKENVLQEDEYDKFYVLKDEDMQKAELQITNYEGSYFLVNYDDYEIVVTKGFEYNKDEKLYKLSEIEKKTESKEQNQEQNPNQENTEIDTNTETKEEE